MAAMRTTWYKAVSPYDHTGQALVALKRELGHRTSGAIDSITVTNETPGAAASETYLLIVVADGGTFKLSYNGSTSASIAFDADPSVVKAAIVALTGFAAADVVVAEGPPEYGIQFVGAHLQTELAHELTADGALLTGSGHAATLFHVLVGGDV